MRNSRLVGIIESKLRGNKIRPFSISRTTWTLFNHMTNKSSFSTRRRSIG